MLSVGGIKRREEATLRLHHLDHRAGLEVLVGMAGEFSAVQPLDRDTKLRIAHRAADGIGSAQLLPVQKLF